MQLSMRGLVPAHLVQQLAGRPSQVWNADVTLPSGACVFVQAPSGRGKTTLIHMLYGLRGGYSGTISFGDRNMEQLPDDQLSALRARQLSVIFQDMRLFPSLTAFENIEVKRALTNSVTTEEVLTWLAQLGIADKAHAQAATLSFGEQQRLAIIRALVQPFSWLLMDEPFSHLDIANRKLAIDLIKNVAHRHNAGIFLTDLDANDYFPYTHTFLM